MSLAKFKAKQMAKLLNLKNKLLEKYPDKADRIEYIINILTAKLQHLRRMDLADYLHTLHLASREFPEFAELIPSEKEVEELLK